MTSGFLIHYGVACLAVGAIMAIFAYWQVRRSITANRMTLMGFLLGVVMWLAWTLPEFSIVTVVVGLITIATCTATSRFLTPLMQQMADVGYKMREQGDEREKREHRT
jgi:hypothetical protein